MTQDVWLVDRWRPPTYRRSFHYRSQSQLSFQGAVELATISRRVGGQVDVTHQGGRHTATDPLGLLLLGIVSGDTMEFVGDGPVDPAER